MPSCYDFDLDNSNLRILNHKRQTDTRIYDIYA